ncbi:uncharacterized protein PV09_06519 [Verruconis gallopava]|uniref:Stress-response A/B barrel domain-containing protein n=1 Tax=Verruconis gallopava TaxID=253628 RepID=A0A0D2A5N5_9PEZI|nr:uncharacterized protein PV09_06519 [Verruconis gallopava]KIW02013.1 hypothetical protein PV09_06519 [Verruconis gallopava]
MPQIQRLTLFKIPDAADLDQALAAYAKLEANNQKDGKPYILQMKAYKLHEDERSQGYTLAARTVFASLDDMKYYDNDCPAHGELKATVKPLIKGGPPLVLYMDF